MEGYGTTHRFPRFPNPFTRAIAADRFAGGRWTTLATHTNISEAPNTSYPCTSQAKKKIDRKYVPQNPDVIRNIEKYLPAVFIVDRAMM